MRKDLQTREWMGWQRESAGHLDVCDSNYLHKYEDVMCITGSCSFFFLSPHSRESQLVINKKYISVEKMVTTGTYTTSICNAQGTSLKSI